MKKLIDRINPSYLEEFKKIENEFPMMFKRCLEELNEKSYWTELSYGTATDLIYYSKMKDYSPFGLSEMFEKHENILSVSN